MITVKSFAFNFVGENTYILYDETKEALIIDCGCMNEEEEQTLSSFIESQQLTPKRLICTHLHFDHVLGNEYIKATYDLSPEAHRTEVTDGPTLAQQLNAFGINFSANEVPVTRFIEEGDTIEFGHSTLRALFVPGHSPGHLAFYCDQERFLIGGDVLFRGSIGRTDILGGDYSTLIRSIQEKIMPLPEETVVYPGHGPSTTVMHEKRNNPYL